MRIPDIIAAHASPGAVVVDLTPADAGLHGYLELPPVFETHYRREPASADVALAIIARVLPRTADELGWAPAPAGQPGRTLHALFLEEVEHVAAIGLLEIAARAGLELLSAHVTQQRPYRIALVFGPTTEKLPEGQPRLRVINENRMNRLVLRVREEQLERSQARAEQLERKLRAVEARAAEVGGEVDRLRADGVRLTDEREEALRRAGHAARAQAEAEAQLTRTRRLLEKARRSIGFRLGRATRVALRDGGWNPVAVPARFAAVWTGDDEVLAELERGAPARSRDGEARRPDGDRGA